MVFNTGAALLDAIVLAVVSRTEEGTYGYKITQDVRETIEVSESTLQFFEDSKKMVVLKCTTDNTMGAIEDIIR